VNNFTICGASIDYHIANVCILGSCNKPIAIVMQDYFPILWSVEASSSACPNHPSAIVRSCGILAVNPIRMLAENRSMVEVDIKLPYVRCNVVVDVGAFCRLNDAAYQLMRFPAS